MKKSHEYQITRNDLDRVMGTVWWDEDKKKIDSSSPKLLGLLKDRVHSGKTMKDGIPFLKMLPAMFNGYISVRKVK